LSHRTRQALLESKTQEAKCWKYNENHSKVPSDICPMHQQHVAVLTCYVISEILERITPMPRISKNSMASCLIESLARAWVFRYPIGSRMLARLLFSSFYKQRYERGWRLQTSHKGHNGKLLSLRVGVEYDLLSQVHASHATS